jgi:hypothetical protein
MFLVNLPVQQQSRAGQSKVPPSISVKVQLFERRLDWHPLLSPPTCNDGVDLAFKRLLQPQLICYLTRTVVRLYATACGQGAPATAEESVLHDVSLSVCQAATFSITNSDFETYEVCTLRAVYISVLLSVVHPAELRGRCQHLQSAFNAASNKSAGCVIASLGGATTDCYSIMYAIQWQLMISASGCCLPSSAADAARNFWCTAPCLIATRHDDDHRGLV